MGSNDCSSVHGSAFPSEYECAHNVHKARLQFESI